MSINGNGAGSIPPKAVIFTPCQAKFPYTLSVDTPARFRTWD